MSNACGDLWRTPKELFDTLNKEFNFVADMAASEQNRLCSIFFDESMDSLSIDWADEPVLQSNRSRYVWCNPPYSNPLPWVNKALEAQKDGLGVVMLLNDDKSVGWFARALLGVSEVRCIIADLKNNGRYSSGRIPFVNGEGNKINGNNKPQFILVFNPHKLGQPVVTTYVSKKSIMGEK